MECFIFIFKNQLTNQFNAILTKLQVQEIGNINQPVVWFLQYNPTNFQSNRFKNS